MYARQHATLDTFLLFLFTLLAAPHAHQTQLDLDAHRVLINREHATSTWA